MTNLYQQVKLTGNMLIKNTLRKIKKSLGRYLSLLLIVLIGVSFYAGIQQSIPQLRNIQNKYYKNTNLADYKIQSNLGLTDDDVKALQDTKNISQVIGTYSKAVFNDDKVIMLHAIEDDLNDYRLIDGRVPKSLDECLADSQHYQIGDIIQISEADNENDINIKEFKVVGTIESPLYSGNDYGSTTIGDGKLYSYLFIDKQCFDYDVYTEIYLTVNKTNDDVAYSTSYKSLIKQMDNQLEDLQPIQEKNRYESIYNEAYQEIADGENELNEQVIQANNEFSEARKQLAEGKNEIVTGQKQLNLQKQQMLDQFQIEQNKLDTNQLQLLEAKSELETKEQEANAMFLQLEQTKDELQQQAVTLNTSLEMLNLQLENELLPEDQKQALIIQKEQLETAIAQINQNIIMIDQQVEQAKEELEAGRLQIEQGLLAIEQGQKTLNEQKQLANQKIEDAQLQLDQGLKEITDGYQTLENNENIFNDKINEAKEEIEDGKNELAKLEQCQWYVMTRDDFVSGYTVLETQCDKVSIIANIIPVFFIAIVVLMTSNTMARMIVEERGEMGTLSSLGIGSRQIIKNYMLYVLSSTFMGAFIGYFIGTVVIPPLVYLCVPSILPPLEYVFDFWQLVIVIVVSCLVMFGVTLVASLRELRNSPATLLRPVPPKNGKTILLERISIIWKHLSFSWKITMRNIARYKKRVFITMVASASCTFIVLIGFAIKDSIQDVGVKQFHDIFRYDNMIILDNPIDNLENSLKETINHHVKNPLLVNQSTVTVIEDDHSLDAYLMTPQDEERFQDYFIMKDVSSDEIISLKQDGVIVSRNVADGFSLDVGDSIMIHDENNHEYQLKVSGIVENYVSCYIYMSPALYQKVISNDLSYNTIFGLNKGKESDISKDVLENEEILTIQFATDLLTKANNGIEGLNNIVVLLVIVASLLDVTVLYNLTSINISERTREISTLKVLGFSDNESNQYIYRETLTVIIIGIALGLILTYPLYNMIIDILESEQMMFLRQIKTMSFVYATVITLFFAIVMQVITYFKLRKIDMIESLKSVE